MWTEASDEQFAADLAATGSVRKLLATGLHDRIVPPQILARLAETSPGRNTQCAVISNCAHLSHEEAVPELLGHLVPFVQAVL